MTAGDTREGKRVITMADYRGQKGTPGEGTTTVVVHKWRQ